MLPERKLSIQIAEFPLVAEDRFHAALLLVDESDGEHVIVQHLHFSDYEETTNGQPNGIIRMIPYVRDGMRTATVDSIKHQCRIIGGDERIILDAWNHMLSHASEVKEQRLIFDSQDRHLPHALNCRMGVISALASIGIKYQENHYKSSAGTAENRISISEVFSFQTQETQDLDVVREQNAALSELLPRPEQEDPNTILAAAAEHLNR